MEKTKLALALELAARGWKVFPITAGKKSPPRIKKWEQEATSDEKKIREWWGKGPDDNIGIATGSSGLCVIDLDIRGEVNGEDELYKLEVWNENLPETLKARTPSGGFHLYFEDLTQTRTGICPGVDIKSAGGYVLAPGSRIGTIQYEWVSKEDAPLKPLPDWLKRIVGKPKERISERLDTPPAGWDNEIDVKIAQRYLKTMAPIAIQGDRGDETTFKVAARVRDMGISEEICFDLLAEFYNERCLPPWELDDLRKKVENAYQYAENSPGLISIMHEFSDRSDFEGFEKQEKLRFYTARDFIQKFIPPQAIIDGLLYKQGVMFLVGPPGVGKSYLALDLCLSFSHRKEYWHGLPFKFWGKSVFVALEGEYALGPRMRAWEKRHGPIGDQNFAISTGEINLQEESDGDLFLKKMKERGPDLIVIDTLQAAWSGIDENSSEQTGRLVEYCKRLHRETGALVVIIHHPPKYSRKTIRGSSVLEGNPEGWISVDYQGEMGAANNRFLMEAMKIRYGKKAEPLNLILRPIRIGIDKEGNEIKDAFVDLDEDFVSTENLVLKGLADLAEGDYKLKVLITYLKPKLCLGESQIKNYLMNLVPVGRENAKILGDKAVWKQKEGGGATSPWIFSLGEA